jgi:glycosyltransferase involved in cell wall biosynthesis
MKIVALLTIRNEERFLTRCLTHLDQEGVKVCVIDNGSTDRSLEIAESFRDKNVIRIEHLPFHGHFALKPILENEERLAREIEAGWFIHHDADEIRQAPAPFPTMAEGIAEVERLGFNAINFNEFVFLPADGADHEGGDYVKTMQYYYFFEPEPRQRINAWKRTDNPVNLTNYGGHRVSFENMRVFPTPFILRHYIALSKAHALAKYCGRVYSESEVEEDSWHGTRASLHPASLRLPVPPS